MKLASVALDAQTPTAIYTCPANSRAVVSLNLCNRGTTNAKVRVALTNGSAPTDADWIEYDTSLSGSAVLERTGLALGAGQSIWCNSDLAAVSAVVWGIEGAV